MLEGCEIRIRREDGELLCITSPLALARAFFITDRSSVGEQSFDALAGRGEAAAIVIEDVIAVNTTMRARSPHGNWTSVIDGDQTWLAGIPADLDLLELDDEQWRAADGDEHLRAAFNAVLGAGRAMAVATKVLHFKRPRLFPVLDRLVAEMFGVNAPPDPKPEQRLQIALDLAHTVRREGRANIDTLRRVRDALADEGIERPLARILDAVVWFSHPAAGVLGAPRMIRVDLADVECE